MGNRRNRARKPKVKRGQILEEWRELKSFGLSKSSKASKQIKDIVRGSQIEESEDVEMCDTRIEDSEDVETCDTRIEVRTTARAETEPPSSTSVPAVQDIVDDIATADVSSNPEPSENILFGRRIVDAKWFLDEIRIMSDHGKKFGCTFNNMVFQSEICRGLRSGFNFRCNMCNFLYTLWSEPEVTERMDINTAAVAAVMGAGGGFTSLQQLMAGMNIRCMSENTYAAHHAAVSEGWESTVLEEMKAAAEEEATLARERGDVDKHGVPLLTVVADASWAKRSYRTNFSSLSGVAAIVGFHTRKVLYIGVKNRYCFACDRNRNSTPKPHKCFKNWNGSSCSMESAAIVEGFLCSEDMYGVKYARLVADGDSSVHQKIVEARPYDALVVEKIVCRNHLLRNYCTKLRDIAATSVRDQDVQFDKSVHLKLRKLIKLSVMRLRCAVTKAVAQRKSEPGALRKRIQDLEKDIINGPSHVFGDHRRCAEYFCTKKAANEENHVPDLMKCTLYPNIMAAVGVLADNAKHLIHDIDSNRAEYYNAVVAKLIGGERVNYCMKGSYQARCSAAVVRHNTKRAYYMLHKTMYKSSPGKFTKVMEERAKRKVNLALQRKLKNPKPRRRLISTSQKTSKHYGPFSQKPDMDAELYERKSVQHFEMLKKTDHERKELEEITREQNENETWREERRLRITASNFGQICRRRQHSNSAPLVSSLLYCHRKDNIAMRYGRENEPVAIAELSKKIGKEIRRCGLFVDPELPFLGATPDGVIGEDQIVEVKCPYSGQNLTPDELINQRKGEVATLFSKKPTGYELNKKHKYYFQVQGQLHVTRRNTCIFTIWTPLGLRTETISRDDEFWRLEMQSKLCEFYHDCLLPELLDPRKRRNMPLREPASILEAQRIKEDGVLAKPLEI